MNRSVIVVSVVAIVCFAIAAVTILLALDKSPAQLIGLLTAIAAPAITSIVALARVETVAGEAAADRARIVKLEMGKDG